MSDRDPFDNLKMPDRTYAVGHGKPPEASRFKKGQSGNPAGRPKQPSARTILMRLLAEELEYVENGRKVRASKKELLITMMINGALKGGVKERAQVLELVARFMPEEFQEEPSAALSPDRQGMLQRLIARIGEGTAQNGQSAPSVERED